MIDKLEQVKRIDHIIGKMDCCLTCNHKALFMVVLNDTPLCPICDAVLIEEVKNKKDL